MHLLYYHTLLLLSVALLARAADSHLIRPFRVALSHGVPRMNDLIQNYRVPPSLPSISSSISPTQGVDAQWLHVLRKSWLEEFDWESRQEYMNSFHHYLTNVEGLDIHFVHAKSTAPPGTDVIPIVLTHGWPGSFLEFLPVVNILTRSNTLKSGRNVSFDVVIPSLPGFAFSSPPPPVWTLNDTARVWNTLMTDVLGYTSGYSVAGTDWGASINWCLLNTYPHAKAAHFNFFAILTPPLDTEMHLSEFERSGLDSAGLFFQSGTAYFSVHQTRPWTLGLAMADNPMGQLAWIAEKYRDWSDPSLVDATYILTTVSLYYLTASFPTSLFVYAQNAGFSPSDVKAATNKPFGYGAFQWEGIRHPKAFVRGLGNLTYYKEHLRGGHFAPAEVPHAYANDIIDMMGTNFPFPPRSRSSHSASAPPPTITTTTATTTGFVNGSGGYNIFKFGTQKHLRDILRFSL